MAFPHVSHRFTLGLAFLGSLFGWFCLVVFVLGCFLFVGVCFVLGGSPRCRDGVVFFPTS